ncbi:SDR family NAD(P)-dependent oxidoreductase [Paenibacillus crassostreae]|uniref:Dehydrogenase n=1 Tax=Paenibacillus crassostreae TaxID=1763538 RepID=A0A167BDN5_9BACL|nr:SDR family NAD(P)-dependent oxidoreductase [Paenibacillus crassostreae]AOZ92937.1 dehydrogenase [Paenibacillus crassostreae]OAB71974.1 dehydrogenase [Paenibacillus crassostreae]
MNLQKQTVIITGGNSGLGYECAKQIAKHEKNYHVVIACRNATKAKIAVDSLIQETNNINITSLELDLSSLESIRDFVSKYSQMDYPPLYALVCNAGVQFIDKTHYTKDGFEATFGVNHLGHFLLANRLLGQITQSGRIVLVSSGTHDPLKKTGMPAPAFVDPQMIAYPDQTNSNENMSLMGRRHYTTSKLCNLYFTYELANLINQQTETNITVNAFDPGMMPGTGLAQSYTPFMKFVWKYVLPALTLFYPNVNTVRQSGRALASLVTDSKHNQTTGKYFEGTKEIKSSELSYNHENRKQLWKASVELSKLNKTETIFEVGF